MVQVEKELDSGEFVYVERGTIVNICHIMSIKDDMILMETGEKLFSSPSRLEEIKKIVSHYWGKCLWQ